MSDQIPKCNNRENMVETIFEAIMIENIQKLMKVMNPQIIKAQQIPSRKKKKKEEDSTVKHNIAKSQNPRTRKSKKQPETNKNLQIEGRIGWNKIF